MRSSSHTPRPPGALYLRTSRWLYEEDVVSLTFRSAIADYQNELRAAGDDRMAHIRARVRWSWALIVLLVVTPFVVTKSVRADHAGLAKAIAGGWLFVALYALPFAEPWSCFREFAIMAGAGGSMLACAMRIRNDQHPSLAGWLGPSVGSDMAIDPAIVPVGSIGRVHAAVN